MQRIAFRRGFRGPPRLLLLRASHLICRARTIITLVLGTAAFFNSGFSKSASAQTQTKSSIPHFCVTLHSLNAEEMIKPNADLSCGNEKTALFGDGASDDTLALRALFASREYAGGSIHLPAGRYLVSGSLAILPGTHLFCAVGTTFVASHQWTAPKLSDLLPGQPILVNANFNASQIMDSDISVDGCGFDYTAITSVEGTHAIRFRMASHIRIRNVICIGGNDCTAMLATNDTLVSHSTCIRSSNACFDHWEGATDFAVSANSISDAQAYGILATGTDTSHATAGIASRGLIDGNRISGSGSRFAAIWLNGIGPHGSGASHIKVLGNSVDVRGNNAVCIKFSGAGSDLLAADNTCINGGGATAISVAADSGGTPSRVLIKNNLIENWSVSSDNIAAITSNGTATRIINNRVKGGTYPYAIWLKRFGQIARGNHLEIGTRGDIYDQTKEILR